VDEEAHEDEVSGEREQAVGEVEAEELGEARGDAVGPGVAGVPGEVVEEGELDGGGGGEEVMVREGAVEEGEREELHGDAEQTDEIEAEVAVGELHARGSWWKSCAV
jgi:hypothetical protein